MMVRVRFGDVVKEVKINIDRATDTHEFYIAGEHMESNNIHLTKRGCFEGSDVGPAFIRLFRPGQVLYGSRRTYLKKVAVADFEGITSNTTFVLETKDESVLLQSLIPFIMLTDSFTEHAVKNSKGSTNPYILFSDLCSYEFELPSIETQLALSAQLWAFDRTAETYKRLLRATEELVKSQFVEMSKGVSSVATRMGDIASYVNGFAFKPKDWASSGMPIIRIQNLNDPTAAYNYFSGEIAEKYIVRHGDVLVSWATHLEAYIWHGNDAWLNQHIFRVIFDKMEVERTFYLYAANVALKEAFKKAHGFKATMEHIKRGDFEDAIVHLPDIDTQKRFAAIVQHADKSKLAIRQSLESLEKSRNALMNQIFG